MALAAVATVAVAAVAAADAPPADAGPDAAIDVRPEPVRPNETVTFDAGGSVAPWDVVGTYAWDVDHDGTWERGGPIGGVEYGSVNETFAEPGLHPVALRIRTMTENDEDTATTYLTVTPDTDNAPPEARFFAADPDPRVNQTFALRATSRDEDGTVREHRWDLDGDGDFEGTGDTVTTSYAEVGEHDVTLMAIDDNAEVDTTTRTVEVLDGEDRTTDDHENSHPPRASFRFDDETVRVGETVTLDATDSSDLGGVAPIAAWDVDADDEWEYGGDLPHPGSLRYRTVEHVFDEPGVHPVTLRVVDDDGATDLLRRPIRVEPADPPDAPTPAIKQHPAGADGDAVQLIASLPAGTDVVEHEWDTDGDGVTDALGPTATAAPGTDVALTIETAEGGVARNATTVADG